MTNQILHVFARQVVEKNVQHTTIPKRDQTITLVKEIHIRTEPRLGLIGTDYEENLEHVFQSFLDQIDCYERN